MSEIRNDPDLYARMAEPYPTREEADAALTDFLRGVADLRVKHRIPEVVLVAAAYLPEAPNTACQTLALGDSAVHPELSAIVYHEHAGPILRRAARLRGTHE